MTRKILPKEAQLQAVDAKMLTHLIRKASNHKGTEVVEWSYTPMREGSINPNTAGIYEFVGTARDHQQQIPWSLVLKIIRWVDFSGIPLENGYSNEPSGWNYWKREALVFQSGILNDLEGNLIPVRCYDVIDQVDGSIWLWLENVKEPDDTTWNLERHVLASRHFGEFNGAYSVKQTIPAYSWLCKRFLRQRVRTFFALGAMDIVKNPHVWDHPRVKQAFPIPVAERIIHLAEDSDGLLAHLERQPQTLSHLDTHRSNLLTRRNGRSQDQTVVIDWSFLGTAAVGEDLGIQISSNLYFQEVDPSEARRYHEAAFEAYMDGLDAAGWRGEREAVRFACDTAASLRLVLSCARSLRRLVRPAKEESWADDVAKKQGCSVKETLERWGQAVYFLLDLADEARLSAEKV